MRRYDSGEPGFCHPVVASENKWRAARYGLDASVVDAGGAAPIRALIARRLSELAPYARELGSERELAGVERILRDGNGAAHQLAAGDARAAARLIAG